MPEQRITVAVPGSGEVSAALAGDPGSATAVLLAHGAGNDMDSEFLRIFHAGLATRGFLCLRFNFLYKQAGRRVPDRRPLLEACYRAAANFVRQLPAPPGRHLVLGGKSMGGRIASHLLASGDGASGLFLGYPLHPPGKPDQLRDQHLYGLDCPLLFLSGTQDAFAQRNLLAAVVGRIGKNATLEWIEGGDHSFRVRGRPLKEVYAQALDTTARWLNLL